MFCCLLKGMVVVSDMGPEKTFKGYRNRLIFGGWFGLHHYYTGNVGRGVLYTFTFGGVFFMWFKDMVNPRRDFNREMAAQGILSARNRG